MQTVTLTAANCELVVTAHGYQYPHNTAGSDANWVHAEAVLTSGRLRGRFIARHEPLWLRTDELQAFSRQLDAVLARRDGVAVLVHLENRIGVTVTLSSDGASLTAFVRESLGRHAVTELRIEGASVDAAGVSDTARELRELVAAYPIRGHA